LVYIRRETDLQPIITEIDRWKDDIYRAVVIQPRESVDKSPGKVINRFRAKREFLGTRSVRSLGGQYR
jgi:hypothetical protein